MVYDDIFQEKLEMSSQTNGYQNRYQNDKERVSPQNIKL